MDKKVIHCDVCDKDYTPPSFYRHRKHSKRHLKLSKQKNQLFETKDIDVSKPINVYLIDIKNKLNNCIDFYIEMLNKKI